MRVTRGYSNHPTRPIQDPLLEADGIWFELRGGDVFDPIGGNWFEEPYPKRWIRFFAKRNWLPFFSYRWGRVGKMGYMGFKAYGVDSPKYKQWMPEPKEVYEGSQALCFSLRPFASIEKEDSRK